MEISSFNISRGFPFSLRPIGCLAGFGSPVVYPFVFRNILSGCAQYRLVMKMSSSLLGKIDRHEVYQTYCSCGRHQVMYGNPQIIYYILLLNDNSQMVSVFLINSHAFYPIIRNDAFPLLKHSNIIYMIHHIRLYAYLWNMYCLLSLVAGCAGNV
jgi:hypothetical protein